jgi:hypothetical protein
MNKTTFPYIAAALGCCLAVIVRKGGASGEDGSTLIPLLTLLLASEFGAIVGVAGFYLGARHFLTSRKLSSHTAATLACAGLVVFFVVQGLSLWPG